jgi:hypothetical protein
VNLLYVQYLVRFQVLVAASMKATVIWDAAPYNIVEIYRRVRVANYVYQAVSTFETSDSFYKTTRRNIAGDNHLRSVSYFHLTTLYELQKLIIE